MTVTTRPWGTYEVLYNEETNFVIKRITVNPKSRLSLQSHEFRSEHWIITEGKGEAILGDDTILLGVNTHIFVPKKVKHRLCNTSKSKLVMVEVQVGPLLSEDDIVRYEDDYDRA